MCGLSGGIGHTINPGIIRCLAVLNEDRGRDATGFFLSSGEFKKINEKSTVWLRDRKVSEWLENACANRWAVCGHTRGGTRGGNFAKNAHPFRYGQIVGSHNGIIDSPNEYTVDSEYAFDLLSKAEPGEYQKALGDVSGWYVLTWLDCRDKCIYMLNWEGTLWMVCHEGTWYYSSQQDHLNTAVGRSDLAQYKVSDCQVVRFTNTKTKGVRCEKLKDFFGKKRGYFNNNNQNNNRQHWTGDSRTHLGRTVRTFRNKPLDVDDWVMKFPNGLWYCRLMNGMWRLLTSQSQLNERFPSEAGLVPHYIEPTSTEKNLASITASTPLVPPPVGWEKPYWIMDRVFDNGGILKDDEVVKIGVKTEDQDSEELKKAKELMDKELADSDRLKKINVEASIEQCRRNRFKELLGDGLTQGEAMRLMEEEGYIGVRE